MSLLERLGRGHLSDATFARLWTAGAAEFDDQARLHPHLAACAVCQARFAQFATWIDGLADEMRDEAEERLTPDRLSAQQVQIGRRLEALDRPARVIAFPKAARAVISGHSHVRRWVTIAAAASLIAGFSLGQFVPLRTALRQDQIATVQPLTHPRTVAIAKDIAPASMPASDEEMMSDVFARSRVSTLSALDDMTPHARDIVLHRRNK